MAATSSGRLAWEPRRMACFDAREAARGLRMVYEPKYLRFFQARFEPV